MGNLSFAACRSYGVRPFWSIFAGLLSRRVTCRTRGMRSGDMSMRGRWCLWRQVPLLFLLVGLLFLLFCALLGLTGCKKDGGGAIRESAGSRCRSRLGSVYPGRSRTGRGPVRDLRIPGSGSRKRRAGVAGARGLKGMTLR